MRIKISEKDIIKYECELLEQDYPKDFPETESILELNWNEPVKRKDSRLSYFSSSQSEDLIYGYFQYGFLASIGLELFEVKFYRLYSGLMKTKSLFHERMAFCHPFYFSIEISKVLNTYCITELCGFYVASNGLQNLFRLNTTHSLL